MKKNPVLLSLFLLVLLFSSCSKVTDYIFPVVDERVSHNVMPVILYDNPFLETDSLVPVQRPEGVQTSPVQVIPLEEEGNCSVSLKKGQALFLLRVNYGNGKVQPSKTGSVSTVNTSGSDSSRNAAFLREEVKMFETGMDFYRYENGFSPVSYFPEGDLQKRIRDFNKNPPVVSGRNTLEKQEKIYLEDDYTGENVGDKGKFWVRNVVASGSFYQADATLRAVGKYCKIWVADNVYGEESSGFYTITESRAKELQEKFDSIYELQTKILGYEYGGGTGGKGGRDGDSKVLILIYDFGNSSATSGYVGFFWGKDYYSQSVLDSSGNGDLKTNYAEIFYIDSKFSAKKPELVESTLSHEFLHMISFNNNVIKNNKSSPTWYDEMMAMMTEDVMSYRLGTLVKNEPSAYEFTTAHPFFRFCDYLTVYPFSGLDMWHEDGFISYANSYGFGSYLLRRFGGSRILSSLIKSGEVGIPSIQKAVSGIQGNLAFEQLYKDYALSFLATGDSSTPVNYFGKSYEEYFSENENLDVVVAGYYPWKTPNQDWKNAAGTSDYPFCNKICGPSVFDLTGFVMNPHSFSIHSDQSWGTSVVFRVKTGSNVVADSKYYTSTADAKKELENGESLYYFLTGFEEDTTLDLDVGLPDDSNVKMYLVVR
ncbi:MAG: hypothetical protein IAA81_03380 [Spirochaetes bacterium]|uniref:Peptidase M30 n=1 Tax=Candidatus Gallitreponema excrementavium TaxID=2840840 RepID=A0A9D9HP16_9SPIR|nr:hypothetical protein [Candidatus Gallitreponema excrementavium]